MKLVSGLCLVFVFTSFGCEKKDPPASTSSAPAPANATSLAITVDGSGYHPAEVRAPAGKLAHLVFTRTSDQGCGQQLVFPAMNIRKDLPLNKAVPVDITMPASGSVAFTCGMAMWKGSVVAQ